MYIHRKREREREKERKRERKRERERKKERERLHEETMSISTQLCTGSARFEWQHGIRRSSIKSRRISLTYRELSPAFSPGGAREDDGRVIVRAMTGHTLSQWVEETENERE